MVDAFNKDKSMRPQIFISSTFYDLKYAREELDLFIREYGFDPIRFETGDVGYTPWQPLDVSCYEAMKASDMAIVIIGGRYGSPTSDTTQNDDMHKSFDSITRREFNTAANSQIPIFVFIQDSVHTEYFLYQKNKDKIENKKIELIFPSVDNINVFRFIESIYKCSLYSITSFKEIRDIKDFLRKQWANLFKEGLLAKKNFVPVKEMQPNINKIYSDIKQMRVLLTKLIEQSFENDLDILEEIKYEQELEKAADKIVETFEFVSAYKEKDMIKEYLIFFIDKLYEAKNLNLLENPFSDDESEAEKFYSIFDHKDVVLVNVNEHLVFDKHIFKDSPDFKIDLVDKLLENENLKKMKFF